MLGAWWETTREEIGLMKWKGIRLARKRAQGQPVCTGPACVHRILRDEGNTGPGSLRKVSVGVLLPVGRTYKSS